MVVTDSTVRIYVLQSPDLRNHRFTAKWMYACLQAFTSLLFIYETLSSQWMTVELSGLSFSNRRKAKADTGVLVCRETILLSPYECLTLTWKFHLQELDCLCYQRQCLLCAHVPCSLATKNICKVGCNGCQNEQIRHLLARHVSVRLVPTSWHQVQHGDDDKGQSCHEGIHQYISLNKYNIFHTVNKHCLELS